MDPSKLKKKKKKISLTLHRGSENNGFFKFCKFCKFKLVTVAPWVILKTSVLAKQ